MKLGRQKKQRATTKPENPHTLTDYMIKKFTGLLAGECSRFLARRLGFPSKLLPQASTRQQERTPGITIQPATQAEKFTSLVIFIQLQITCRGLQ